MTMPRATSRVDTRALVCARNITKKAQLCECVGRINNKAMDHSIWQLHYPLISQYGRNAYNTKGSRGIYSKRYGRRGPFRSHPNGRRDGPGVQAVEPEEPETWYASYETQKDAWSPTGLNPGVILPKGLFRIDV